MSSASYLTSNSPSSSKTAAAEQERTVVEGYLLPVNQSVFLPNTLKHETIIIPSSSTPSFGSFHIFNFREKNVIINNFSLQFVTSSISGTSLTCYAVPAFWFFTKIEITQNGVLLDTVYSTEQFLRAQMLNSDEDRMSINASVGMYNSSAARTLLSSTTNSNTYIVALNTLFDQTRMNLLNSSHNIELRVYMDTTANIYTIVSGSNLTVSMLSSSLICNATRLDINTVISKLNQMIEYPFHSIFHETALSSNIVPIGVTTVTLPLTQICGNISSFVFVVRPTSTATSSTGFWTFIQIASFSLLDAGGQNLLGGNGISAALASTLNRGWMQSSYNVENSLTTNDQNANLYMWSHSADPVSSLRSGLSLTTRYYTGGEQLQITFKTALTQTYTVDLYAYRQAIHEMTSIGVRKV